MSGNPTSSNQDDELSWANARQFAGLVQPIPDSVLQAVAALWANHLETSSLGSEDIYPKSVQSLRRVDRSAKLKTPIYFAASSLFPEAFDAIQSDDSVKAILEVLRPGLFATFLALVYLHRRLNKLCEEREGWPALSKEFVANMELGYLAGLSVPDVGPMLGTLICGLRYAALGTLLLWTPEPFKRYRRTARRRIDSNLERVSWICDTAQITATLFRDLGFRNDIFNITQALRGERLDELPADLRCWSDFAAWVDAAHTESALDPAIAERLNLTPAQVADLSTTAAKIDKGDIGFAWMMKASKSSGGGEEQQAPSGEDE